MQHTEVVTKEEQYKTETKEGYTGFIRVVNGKISRAYIVRNGARVMDADRASEMATWMALWEVIDEMLPLMQDTDWQMGTGRR